MALFSRRPKDASGSTSPQPADQATEDAAAAPAGDASAQTPGVETEAGAAEAGTAAEEAASVSISLSSYGGLGAPAPRPAAPPVAKPAIPAPVPRTSVDAATRTAPPQTETVPGLRDNVLVRAALANVGESAPPQALLDVARQMLQGHLFLRVKGDARTLLAEGKDLPLGMVTLGERRFTVAYSSGAALQAAIRADGDVETSAMGQPVLSVIRHVLGGGFDGLIIDQSSAPARAVLPAELLKRMVDKIDEQLTIKTLLAGERTAETAPAVVKALATAPLWIAVGKLADGRPGIAEGRSKEGERFLEVFSHPLEVAVLGRPDQAAPLTAAQLAGAIASDEGLSGIVIDPAGPWIRLSREDLAPLLSATS
ncbi:hypothetical protein ASD56_07610 [Microbacterium sp. Root166]|uniref:SseB family protein n=1 Tax=Microbacterium sp. Root166 TaxID=1736478 RepID=UPI0006F483D6|nr:SseB family protein [Microbacterium sp. Root166]KQZ86118.1 hypothetical protein ASD56_07610 [Microbacterium sp. Root166]